MSIDQETVRQAALGDRASQQRIYEQLSRPIGALVQRIVGKDAAEDVTQDVFVNIFTKMHSYQATSSFSTWAYRVAVNDALQYLRRARRQSTLAFDEAAVAAQEPPQQLDLRDLLDVALSRLDAELKVVLQLKEVENLSYDQIAEIVNIPVGTVGSRLNKARRELRDQLQRLGWEGR